MNRQLIYCSGFIGLLPGEAFGSFDNCCKFEIVAHRDAVDVQPLGNVVRGHAVQIKLDDFSRDGRCELSGRLSYF